MDESQTLLELSYKDMFNKIAWDFIHMQQHYEAIRKLGVSYEGAEFDLLKFSTPSESRPGLRHKQWVQLTKLKQVLGDPNYSIGDKVKIAMQGDLKVHCDCEAFLMWGYQFILLTSGAALLSYAKTNPETEYNGQDITAHPPDIRNPRRRGMVCKHLGNVIKVLPFWWNTIAGELQKAGYDLKPPSVVQVKARKPAPAPPPPAPPAQAIQRPGSIPPQAPPPAPQQAPEQPVGRQAYIRPVPQVPVRGRAPVRAQAPAKKKPGNPPPRGGGPPAANARKKLRRNLLHPGESLAVTTFGDLVEDVLTGSRL